MGQVLGGAFWERKNRLELMLEQWPEGMRDEHRR